MSPEQQAAGPAGEMTSLVAAKDWGQTALGPRATWSHALETAVGICLAARFPMLVMWGPEEIMVYNDGYAPMLQDKHPGALGIPLADAWPEVYELVGAMNRSVRETGRPTWSEDLPLVLERRGFPEQCHFTFSMSAIPEDGTVAGILATVNETTAKVVGDRRMALVGRLVEIAAQARSQEDLYPAVAAALTDAPDVPFARLHLLDDDGALAVPLSAGVAPPLPEATLRDALDGATVVVDALGAVALPVHARGDERPRGVLVAGLNPARPRDADAVAFLTMVADAVATAVAAVLAAEAERRARERAEELSAAKSTFLSTVSHEFRTPITLLLGPLDDALASGALDADDRERIVTAQRNALRLRRLVDSLLRFGAGEDPRPAPEWQTVDLAELTAGLAGAFDSAARDAGLKLAVDCPPLPQPVVVDLEGWERVVLNLLSNAFKHTFEGSIAIAIAEHGDGIELTVTDTGAGIPADELPRLFERFHRVAGAPSRSHEGSGIGLALVAEVVAQHEGTVEVDSRLGEGSTFRVRIPYGHERVSAEALAHPLGGVPSFAEEYVAELPAWDHGPEEPKARDGKRPRVLVADDNADMRGYLHRLLGREFDVDVVGDGDAALERALAAPPDLVLADVMMPGLDGLELLARLRAEPATQRVPIILLSARAGREASVEALESGADDYLVKPFSAPELSARVRANLELGAMRERATAHQAALYAREHALVEQLQRSLLPAEFPDLPDVRLAGRYLPASTEPAVGGDWFDVMRLPDERVLVVVGDVVGHGLQAATTMAHLQTATRAYAAEGHDAAGIVERVSMLVERTDVGLASTMALACVDTGDGRFSYASAGHPPLLVCGGPDGARWLETALGPPLGLASTSQTRQAEGRLALGETLMLYTDGLVERRGTELQARFDALAAAGAEAGGDPERLLGHLVHSMDVVDRRDDDVALLALQHVAARSTTAFAVGSADDLAMARERLRDWLAVVDTDHDTIDEVVLAVSEALINAVEHGSGGAGTPVLVRATVHDDQMRIVVRDTGRWRRQEPTRSRGHGLRIMRAVMDEVTIDPTADGTRVELGRRVPR